MSSNFFMFTSYSFFPDLSFDDEDVIKTDVDLFSEPDTLSPYSSITVLSDEAPKKPPKPKVPYKIPDLTAYPYYDVVGISLDSVQVEEKNSVCGDLSGTEPPLSLANLADSSDEPVSSSEPPPLPLKKNNKVALNKDKNFDLIEHETLEAPPRLKRKTKLIANISKLKRKSKGEKNGMDIDDSSEVKVKKQSAPGGMDYSDDSDKSSKRHSSHVSLKKFMHKRNLSKDSSELQGVYADVDIAALEAYKDLCLPDQRQRRHSLDEVDRTAARKQDKKNNRMSYHEDFFKRKTKSKTQNLSHARKPSDSTLNDISSIYADLTVADLLPEDEASLTDGDEGIIRDLLSWDVPQSLIYPSGPPPIPPKPFSLTRSQLHDIRKVNFLCVKIRFLIRS